MNFIDSLNILGVEAKQIPCIILNGAPTTATEGAVGVLGMDITSAEYDLYKCVVAEEGVYTWKKINSGEGSSEEIGGVEWVQTDTTLTQEGQPADAKATGDAIAQKSQVQIITSDVSETLDTLKIHKITQEEYAQRLEDGTLDNNTLYLTPDKEIGGVEQVQADWAQTDETQIDYIKNKPTIPADIANLTATINELNYMSGVTNNVQTQLNDKVSSNQFSQKAKELEGYADTAASSAANQVKNDLLNGAGAAYDTLKELADLIDENTDAIDALEDVASGKANADHAHADIYYTKDEVNTAIEQAIGSFEEAVLGGSW